MAIAHSPMLPLRVQVHGCACIGLAITRGTGAVNAKQPQSRDSFFEHQLSSQQTISCNLNQMIRGIVYTKLYRFTV